MTKTSERSDVVITLPRTFFDPLSTKRKQFHPLYPRMNKSDELDVTDMGLMKNE